MVEVSLLLVYANLSLISTKVLFTKFISDHLLYLVVVVFHSTHLRKWRKFQKILIKVQGVGMEAGNIL